MDHGACNVIYTNRRAKDEHVFRESLSKSLLVQPGTGPRSQDYFGFGKPPALVKADVEQILSTFNEVHICGSGQSCLSKISQLHESTTKNVPTIVLIDIPYDEEQRRKRLSREPRSPSPTTARPRRSDTLEPDDIYGMHLLMTVYSEIQSQNFSRLVIPVVVLSGIDRGDITPHPLPSPGLKKGQVLTDPVRLVRYLDAGAVDVLSSPLSQDNVQGLAVHAYRVHKEISREEAAFLTTKRTRKMSWVGVSDAKPYAYLREAMVSSLMSRICNPETVADTIDPNDLYLAEGRHDAIAAAIGSWSFSAHEFTDDELLYGALLMLKHALQMPELHQWRMDDDDLIVFLLASRTAYNEFVLYHNFRHVSDVLQALFFFLVQIGTLPPYPVGSAQVAPAVQSPIAQLLSPFDALTLLISAIGHDVGHPGVNNAFLVALNAPLAQLYNDRSVLESFHCAAYSQILRRYWPKAFADPAMRKLMINSILATDMGLHFKYMTDLGNLQQKIAHDRGAIDAWNAKLREENKDLACGLLIKCADISNVARKFEVAAQWANILTDEFSNQGVMEQELEIPSCLFGGPPVRDDLIKLAESQIGFINIFARPLFEGVADILPGMYFAVEEMVTNNARWERKIEETKQSMKKNPLHLGLLLPSFAADPGPSPFSGPPLRVGSESPVLRKSHLGRTSWEPKPNHASGPAISHRRHSSAFLDTIPSTSQSPELGLDKSTSIPGIDSPASHENLPQSRRGSADAALTAIVVTQTPNSAQVNGSSAAASSPADKRKDTTKKYPAQNTSSQNTGEVANGGARPLTAPAPARSNNNTANGTLDAPNLLLPDMPKFSPDSDNANPSRESARRSEWWRLNSRRRAGENRDGEIVPRDQHKEMMLRRSISNTDATTASPTTPSPTRTTMTGKLKTFFKRRPRNSNDHEKQLSSFGSSSQLRTTPPTSDPGVSVNSDD